MVNNHHHILFVVFRRTEGYDTSALSGRWSRSDDEEYLIPLFGLGSTRSGKGTGAVEVSATALCWKGQGMKIVKLKENTDFVMEGRSSSLNNTYLYSFIIMARPIRHSTKSTSVHDL